MMVSKANDPKYKTEARLTNTYKPIQKMARMVLSCGLYLFSTNSGIVYKPFSMKMGSKNLPTTSSVSAAIHSYDAMANPNVNPLPDMPMNCSALMLAAIKLAPMAHHGKLLLAKK